MRRSILMGIVTLCVLCLCGTSVAGEPRLFAVGQDQTERTNIVVSKPLGDATNERVHFGNFGAMYPPELVSLTEHDGGPKVVVCTSWGFQAVAGFSLFDPETGWNWGPREANNLELPQRMVSPAGGWNVTAGKPIEVDDGWRMQLTAFHGINIEDGDPRFHVDRLPVDRDFRPEVVTTFPRSPRNPSSVIIWNGQSDGHRAIVWEPARGDWRPAEVPGLPIRYVSDVAVNEEAGTVAIASLRDGDAMSGIYLYAMNGSTDPEAWTPLDFASDRRWAGCARLARDGSDLWFLGEESLECCTVHDNRLAQVEAIPLPDAVERKAGSQIGKFRDRVIVMVGPREGPTADRPMCVLSFDLQAREWNVEFDFRPGSELNPDGGEVWLADCVVAPNGS